MVSALAVNEDAWRVLLPKETSQHSLISTTSILVSGNERTTRDQAPICSSSTIETALDVRDKCMHMCTERRAWAGLCGSTVLTQHECRLQRLCMGWKLLSGQYNSLLVQLPHDIDDV